MEKYNFEVSADYFQFLMQDENSDGDISELWTEQSVKDMIIVKNDVIGIGTVRDMTVAVSVELAETDPDDDDAENWDQIIECGIDLPSGKIVVMGVTDYFPDAPRINTAAGRYRARIYYGNLNSVSEDGFDGEDQYRIVLWPAVETRGLVYIKKYQRYQS